MRSFIVGTAGHIDHGKSALVLALTGTDPDRLKEEKERGITIDLGFAHLPLGDGLVVSFIDVPGHERFVRNMLAGAHGIDAALLVVAADESVMPQTREHFEICRLLGIPRGLVALTKCDIAGADAQAVAEIEAQELVAGSFLEGAEVLRVSAKTGMGLDVLKDRLRGLAATVVARPSDGVLRLPVDRVFTMRGFGTVVTGTLVSGALAVGDDVEVLPSAFRSRVRGLQVHGEAVERVGAGNRAAVNLAGVEVEDLARGDVLAHPATLRPTSMLDAEITLLAGGRPLKDGARVRVHLASAEVLARVRLLEAPALEPGSSGLAQLRLERQAVAGRGDRLILRSYSPSVTIGGALVFDPLPPKRRSADAAARARIRSIGRCGAVEAATLLVAEAGSAGLSGPLLAARVTAPLAALVEALRSEPAVASFGKEPVSFLSRAALDALSASTRRELGRFHKENPLKSAMAREELRRLVFGRSPAGAFEFVIETLAASGEARTTPDSVALARHAVTFTSEEQTARDALLSAAVAAGLEGLDPPGAVAASRMDARLLQRISRVLLDEGLLRRVGEDRWVHRDHLESLKARVRRRWPPGSRLDVGAFKELTGLTRKYVIPLLEYLDRERVTRRSGNDRLVLM